MPTPVGLGMILEGRAIVQGPSVVAEEHIARTEHELRAQVGTVHRPVEGIERPDLIVRQGLARLLMTDLDPGAEVSVEKAIVFAREHGR